MRYSPARMDNKSSVVKSPIHLLEKKERKSSTCQASNSMHKNTVCHNYHRNEDFTAFCSWWE